jgi:hypothetical protein
MFFPDLGTYDYYSTRPFPGVRTIGWLDDEHPFPKGDASADIIDKLRLVVMGNERVNVVVNPIRGVHPCNLCGADRFPNSDLRMGSTEIWIPYDLGKFYAAPSMIFHYIEDHQYEPPRQFLEAVANLNLNKRFNAQEEYDKLASMIMSS